LESVSSYETSETHETHGLSKPSGLITPFSRTKFATGPMAAWDGRKSERARTNTRQTDFNITGEQSGKDIRAKVPHNLNLRETSCRR